MIAIINFKTDKKVKSEAQMIAKKMGINLSDVLNILLRSFVRDKEISARLEEPSDWFVEQMAEVEKEKERGEISPAFDNAKDALKWLHGKNSKYANQI
jgi:addiction module RelB/DinJ family antitoxin